MSMPRTRTPAARLSHLTPNAWLLEDEHGLRHDRRLPAHGAREGAQLGARRVVPKDALREVEAVPNLVQGPVLRDAVLDPSGGAIRRPRLEEEVDPVRAPEEVFVGALCRLLRLVGAEDRHPLRRVARVPRVDKRGHVGHHRLALLAHQTRAGYPCKRGATLGEPVGSQRRGGRGQATLTTFEEATL